MVKSTLPSCRSLSSAVARSATASIAFAQLAEEYRRAGDCQAAVAACRAGLQTRGVGVVDFRKAYVGEAALEHP